MASILERVREVKAARASGGGRRYFKEGMHYALIDGVREDKKQTTKIDYLAAEFTIVTTDSEDPDMRVGNKTDWAAFSDQQTYLGNVKNFACAALGLTEADFDALTDKELDELFKLMIGKDQACVGKVIKVECVPMVSKGKGKIPAGETYIVPHFVAVPDEEQKEILEAYRLAKVAN